MEWHRRVLSNLRTCWFSLCSRLLSQLLSSFPSNGVCGGPCVEACLSWFWEIISNENLTYLLVLWAKLPTVCSLGPVPWDLVSYFSTLSISWLIKLANLMLCKLHLLKIFLNPNFSCTPLTHAHCESPGSRYNAEYSSFSEYRHTYFPASCVPRNTLWEMLNYFNLYLKTRFS